MDSFDAPVLDPVNRTTYSSVKEAHSDCVLHHDALVAAEGSVRYCLYRLLASLMEFKIVAEKDKDAFDKLCKSHGIPTTAKSGTYTRLINLIWGKNGKRTKSALRYAKVLLEAEKQKKTSADLVQWINDEGGIEEVLSKLSDDSKPQPTPEELEEAAKLRETILSRIDAVTSIPVANAPLPAGHAVAVIRYDGSNASVLRVLDKKYTVDGTDLLESVANCEREASLPWAGLFTIREACKKFSPQVIIIKNSGNPRAHLCWVPPTEEDTQLPFYLTISLGRAIESFPTITTIWQKSDIYSACTLYSNPSNKSIQVNDNRITFEAKHGPATWLFFPVDHPLYKQGGFVYQQTQRKNFSTEQVVTYVDKPALWSAVLDEATIHALAKMDGGMKRTYYPKENPKDKKEVRRIKEEPLRDMQSGALYTGKRYMIFTINGDKVTFAPVVPNFSGAFRLLSPADKEITFATMHGTFTSTITKLANTCGGSLDLKGSESTLVFTGEDRFGNEYSLTLPLIAARLGSMDFNCNAVMNMNIWEIA